MNFAGLFGFNNGISYMAKKSDCIDGIETDFHNAFFKKGRAKQAKAFLEKFSFLYELGFYCTFIDLPNLFDIVVLRFSHKDFYDVEAVYERGGTDILICVETNGKIENTDLALTYFAYNYSEKIRLGFSEEHYQEDAKKYLNFFIDNKIKIDMSVVNDFYKENPINKIEWLE